VVVAGWCNSAGGLYLYLYSHWKWYWHSALPDIFSERAALLVHLMHQQSLRVETNLVSTKAKVNHKLYSRNFKLI